MLHIRIKTMENESLARENLIKQDQNIRKLFDQYIIEDSTEIRRVIHEIDGGEFFSSDGFIDRFGYKTNIDYLSTGCKSAILVINHPDKWIDLTSSGLNARDSIIRNLRNGKIILPYEGVSIAYSEDGVDDTIDVEIYGYRITKLSRLNSFLFDEWDGEHDLTTGNIEKIN